MHDAAKIMLSSLPWLVSSAMAASAFGTDKTVWHIVWTGGQSNSVGTNSQTHGFPVWPTTDRIQNFCWLDGSHGCKAGNFSAASVPLVNEHNVGFSQTFANLLLPTLPPDDGIILVNTGVGGTGFIDGHWVVPNGDLLKQSIGVVQALVEALPGALAGTYSLHSLLWHQGEDDAGDNRLGYQATYCQYLEADLGSLIDYLRAKMPGASASTPFLAGGMLPYWVDAVKGTTGVMNAIYALNTSRRYTGTADSRIFPDFFPGTRTPAGEPDFRSGVTGDVIHFNATQNVLLGHQYFEAYGRAAALHTLVPSAETLACNKTEHPTSAAPGGCSIAPPPLPKYHISVNLGNGPRDMNAIFQYRGVWHVMHQANWTDWAHLVSTDLVRWTRLPSALSPNGDWDGTLTILDGKPIILYDCYNVADCKPPAKGFTSPDDPAIVGVARPVNSSDPNLTKWTKDYRNPIKILNGSSGAGPSNMWRSDDGRVNFVMAQRGGRPAARYQSYDPALHNWSVGTPYPFYEDIGGGVAMFYPLPKPGRRAAAPGEPTHLFGHVVPPPGHARGTPWFALGTYDDHSGAFQQTGSKAPLERSEMMVFGTLGSVGGNASVAGDEQAVLSTLIALCHGPDTLDCLVASVLLALPHKPSSY